MGANQPAPAGEIFRGLGLEIQFPFSPYGVQKAMMNSVTSTLTNKTHCLIESPTGTGKTLVLLCATLAWRQKSKKLNQPFISPKLRKQIGERKLEKLRGRPCTCGRRPNRSELQQLKEAKNTEKGCDKSEFALPEKDINHDKGDQQNELAGDESSPDRCKRMRLDKSTEIHKLETSPYFKKDPECIILDDDDCQVVEEFELTKPALSLANGKVGDDLKSEDTQETNGIIKPSPCKSCLAIEAEEKFTEVLGEDSMDGEDFIASKIGNKIPKIYYGTRTHKQIAQVVRELNKTPYCKNLRMSILSSRERTCINDQVKDMPNRNDLCRELAKNKQKSNNAKSKDLDTCPYYHDSNTISALFEVINLDYADKSWDIEDACTFGRGNYACPYYGLRAIQETSDITFCPYNYLLDPTIRRTLNINISNSIIIFDEAHNIEDICRTSASFEIDNSQIDGILETINVASSHYLQGTTIMDAYYFFKEKLLTLKSYLINFNFEMITSNGDGTKNKYFNQDEMLTQLIKIGFGPDDLPHFRENLKALKGDDDEDKSNRNQASDEGSALDSIQLQYIAQLCLTLDFMYNSNLKYFNDYRAVVTMCLDRERGRGIAGRQFNRTPKKSESAPQGYIYKFSLVCMNSGIAFEKIHTSAWSVIVASGTLSPIASLKSELGCNFTYVFEGAHVIPEDRIFASILTRGPDGSTDLNCSFANSSKLTFQDQMGLVVRDTCRAVPYGVLCFFPSYDRLEKLHQRWFAKGIINEIQRSGKKLYMEKKNSSVSDFEVDLEKYNKCARNKGAVLFAVFRGKVSEGIDFADRAARAVITIGIPYPNTQDINVGLKKDYNDSARAQRPELLSGRDWYGTQAFRALNQALGRCIRHKDDWGAIIMVDSRLTYNQSSISKWLRKVLVTYHAYGDMQSRLQEFVQTRISEG